MIGSFRYHTRRPEPEVWRFEIMPGPRRVFTGKCPATDLTADEYRRERSSTPSGASGLPDLNDPFNVHHQIANCMALMGLSKQETLLVSPGETVRGNYHILINSYTTHQHGSTIRPEFENVWDYLGATSDENARIKASPALQTQPPLGH